MRFLARQGLLLRDDVKEENSNFIQLYNLRVEDSPGLVEWLNSKRMKYTSGDIQNEIIRIMAMQVLRDIGKNLHQTPFYAIMADETYDVSNHEQLVVCIRWADDAFEVHEDFIGLYKTECTDSQTLVRIIVLSYYPRCPYMCGENIPIY